VTTDTLDFISILHHQVDRTIAEAQNPTGAVRQRQLTIQAPCAIDYGVTVFRMLRALCEVNEESAVVR
jgi:hypothetical protein